MWQLIGALWDDVPNAEALAQLQAARDAESEARRAQWEREAEERRANVEATRDAEAVLIAAALPKLAALPVYDGARFVRVGEYGTFLYELRKRGATLCYASRKYSDGMRELGTVAKWRKFDATKRTSLERSLAAGRIFALPEVHALAA